MSGITKVRIVDRRGRRRAVRSIRGGRPRAAQSNEARWSDTQDNWGTPGNVVAALQHFNDWELMALDPCSNPSSIVTAAVEWYGPHVGGTDGIVMPWARKGLVFVNPPYSAKLIWIRKCANEAACGSEIISLVPADTDTQWFQRYGLTSKEKCFWRGRLTFRGDKSHPARFPCVLLYWGRRRARFRRIFGQHGWVP
jgi:hypothetical protein